MGIEQIKGSSYGPINYGSDPFAEVGKILSDMNRQRLVGSRELTGDQALAHKEVLEKIRNKFPLWDIERKVLYGSFIESYGALVTLDDGNSHIILDSDIASYGLMREQLREFTRGVTARDVMKNVIAHEYSHIWLGQASSRRHTSRYGESPIEPIIPIEEDEGFAFWFGDTMSGVKTPLNTLRTGYLRRGVDFDRSIATYQKLENIEREQGIEKILDPHTIIDFLVARIPKPKKDRVFSYSSRSKPIAYLPL